MHTAAEGFSEGFVQLLEAAPDAMVVVAQDGRVVAANAQASALFGHPTEVLTTMRVEDLLPQRFRERHVGHRDAYVRTPRVRPMGAGLDLFGMRSDGTEVPVEISLSPLALGDRRYTIAAVRDVTERRRSEVEARRNLVARQLVRQLMRKLTEVEGNALPRRDLGRSLTSSIAATDAAGYLEAYQAMGAGALRVEEEKPPRYEFSGEGLLEVTPGHATPTCHVALGYLEGVVGRLSGGKALGAEVRCQSQGHDRCHFVVTARPK